jgi:hypothetical protein
VHYFILYLEEFSSQIFCSIPPALVSIAGCIQICDDVLETSNPEIYLTVGYCSRQGFGYCGSQPLVVELEEAPEFEALSYVWGLPNDPVGILCDNEVVPVTQNLHGALVRLRRSGDSDQPRRVWIDALCINQTDIYERSQQISFMKDIYYRAKHVVAWLGPDEDGQAALAISIIVPPPII